MKKLFVSAGVISAMFLASCGGGSGVCDCADMAVAMMNEMKDLDGDMEKMTAITENYADDMKKCEAMEDGKSEEELKAMEEEMKGCASFKEMEKMMGAQ
jgi:hypothetical protein